MNLAWRAFKGFCWACLIFAAVIMVVTQDWFYELPVIGKYTSDRGRAYHREMSFDR